MWFIRGAALAVAAAYLVAAVLVVPRDAQALVTCALVTVLPLPFIWFSEAFGSYTGIGDFGGYVNRSTPGPVVAAAGCVVLAVVPPVVIALHS